MAVDKVRVKLSAGLNKRLAVIAIFEGRTREALLAELVECGLQPYEKGIKELRFK